MCRKLFWVVSLALVVSAAGTTYSGEALKPKVIWVSYHDTDAASAGAASASFVDAPDKGYTDLLKTAGYDVIRYLQTATPDVNMLNAADLVIISRSVASASFQNAAATIWNTKITAPVINVNAWTVRKSRLGFVTASNNPADATGNLKLQLIDPNHPIFAGIARDANGVMINDFGGAPQKYPDGTVSLGVSVSTDPMNAQGVVLATIPAGSTTGPANAMVIAEWAAGATLVHDGGAGTDVLAGRRLVFYTGSRENQSKTGSGQAPGQFDLTPDGARMFLNAAAYMSVRPPVPKKVAWVSYHATDAASAGAAGNGFVDASDKGYTDLLQANGYSVTRVLQTGTPDVNALNAFDLVIISRSVASASFQNAAADTWNTKIAAPMIITGGYLSRKARLGFMTASNLPDTTGDIKLTIADPNHPIFAGIARDANGVMVNNYAGICTYPDGVTKARGISIVTDPIIAGGELLAGLAAASGTVTAGSAVIAEWLPGATVIHDGGAGTNVLVGRRLVFLTGSREANGKSGESAGMFDLAPDGAKLFLNAVAYLMAPLPEKPAQ